MRILSTLQGVVFLGLVFFVRGALALLLYGAIVFALIVVWVLVREEPVLRARFGAAYADYTRRVPRWVGRRSP
jgi:protein-S-isoprenylcysteine O-methyltransferase Ste14